MMHRARHDDTMSDVEDRIMQLSAIQQECLELFARKNRDYGNAFADAGPVGVLVRIGDKLKRLQSVTHNGINLVADEKVRDTLIDLANYAMMAVMLLDEPDESNSQNECDRQMTMEAIMERLPQYEAFFQKRAAESDAPKNGGQ